MVPIIAHYIYRYNRNPGICSAAKSWDLLGSQLSAAGRPDDGLAGSREAAAISCRSAATSDDRDIMAQPLTALGIALAAQGRTREAAAAGDQAAAIRLWPRHHPPSASLNT